MSSEIRINISIFRLFPAEVCKSCLKKQQQIEAGNTTKVVTVDKSSATDPITSADLELELLKELKFDMEDVKKLEDHSDQSTIDLTAAKREADHSEKMCPLCGKIYSSNIMFDTFQEHVESHFVDELPSTELSLERNFEVISHSVGNF
jgi:Autophagy receptor zinc finger-C2H2 domain